MNPVAETLTGWRRSDALGKEYNKVLNVVQGETRGKTGNTIGRLFLDGAVIPLKDSGLLVGLDGTRTSIEYSAGQIKDDKGNTLGIVLVFRDITEREAQVAAQEYQMFHDALTGLPNRVFFYDRLQQAILSGHRFGTPLAVLLIGLDHFKEINQKMGRHIGDLLLQQVGQRLWDTLRRSDTVARIGGCEFAVLLPSAGHLAHATKVTGKVLKAMEEPFILEGQTIRRKAHVGIALFPDHSEDADTLLHQGSMALKMAKQAGNGYALYSREKSKRPKKRGSFLDRRSNA
jgi:diguanylate cyclase (GGDEF)-like protein/PAS domain S-box-containing protein